MSTSDPTTPLPTFSGEFIRLLVGLITLTFPWVIWVASAFSHLTSISGSYYTSARNLFVGLLFVLGAFLFVYKGRGRSQPWVAKLGALAPVTAALFPTSCDTCASSTTAYIHLGAGAVMFGVAAYFCLGPFRQSANAKPGPEAGRRSRTYTICGWTIIAFIALLAAAKLPLLAALPLPATLTFWAEVVMLGAFGIAWMVASQFLPWFTTSAERHSVRRELSGNAAPTAPAPNGRATPQLPPPALTR